MLFGTICKNQRGFTIVELILAGGLSALVIYGTVGIFSFVNDLQTQGNTKTVMVLNNFSIQSLANNNDQWIATLRNPENLEGHTSVTVAPLPNQPNMRCLINNSDCAQVGATGNFYPFDLGDADLTDTNFSQPIFAGYANLALPDGSKLGLKGDGSACATFAGPTAATGNDDCPLGYNLEWRPVCPPALAPCIRPQVEIRMTWFYKPAANSKYKFPVNPNFFNFTMYRLDTIRRNEAILVTLEQQAHEGPCVPNSATGTPRQFNKIIYDQGRNVRNIYGTGAQDSIELRTGGTYQCRVSAPIFNASGGTRSYQVFIRSPNGTETIGVDSGGARTKNLYGTPIYVSAATSGLSKLEATLTPQGASEFVKIEVRQLCEFSDGKTNDSEDLGFAVNNPPDPSNPSNLYSNIYSTFECMRTQ